MYVKLIQPRMRRRPMDTDIKLRMSPPLGLYTIANLLRGAHRVVVENENLREICYDDCPDIVGISVTVDVLPRAVEIAARFREKGALVVAGGIHITTAERFVPDDSFDVLCIGPAEGTWPQLMADVERNAVRPVYRCGRAFSGADIASPAYDLIHAEDYLYCNIVHTSRGCPFQCDFCYNSAAERRYVKRPIQNVLADIRATGSSHIMFIDDNLMGDPVWLREFLRVLKPMGIRWNGAVSVDVVDHPDLLDEMKQSGCRSLFIGLESISDASLGSVHKRQNSACRNEQVVEALHQRGIMVHGSFVFGLDSDTPETFRRTLEWIVAHKIETVTSHILTPYPGTRLYDEMARAGRLLTGDLSLYNTANVVFQPKNMTAEQLRSGYLWMYRQVYSVRNILRRMPACKTQRAAYLTFNLLYRKLGAVTDLLCRVLTYRRVGRMAQYLSRYLTSGRTRTG